MARLTVLFRLLSGFVAVAEFLGQLLLEVFLFLDKFFKAGGIGDVFAGTDYEYHDAQGHEHKTGDFEEFVMDESYEGDSQGKQRHGRATIGEKGTFIGQYRAVQGQPVRRIISSRLNTAYGSSITSNLVEVRHYAYEPV